MSLHNIQHLRDEFETIRKGIIFVNHAGTVTLPKRCADAMKKSIELNQTLQVSDFMQMMGMVEDCRNRAADMLNVSSEEIALTRNTTEGINFVANGLNLNEGDRVVTINGEYPANIYPWLRLQEKGVDVHLIEPVDHRVSMEQLEDALTPNTKLLTLSFVDFVSGFRFDLEAVGKLCAEKGVLFHVDLIQGMGVLPVDFHHTKVSFASVGAQKWLLGPMGAGIFYCSKDCMDSLETTVVGATSVKDFIPYLNYDYSLLDTAKRFEYSASAVHEIIGMGASLTIFLEFGMEFISHRIKLLTDILYEGALNKGYECVSPRGEGQWSGILSFKHPKKDTLDVVDQLGNANIFTREREGYIRLSPHFYQTEDEMRKIVEVL